MTDDDLVTFNVDEKGRCELDGMSDEMTLIKIANGAVQLLLIKHGVFQTQNKVEQEVTYFNKVTNNRVIQGLFIREDVDLWYCLFP